MLAKTELDRVQKSARKTTVWAWFYLPGGVRRCQDCGRFAGYRMIVLWRRAHGPSKGVARLETPVQGAAADSQTGHLASGRSKARIALISLVIRADARLHVPQKSLPGILTSRVLSLRIIIRPATMVGVSAKTLHV